MSSFFETELSNLKSVGNTLRKDILRYRKNQEFVQPVSTLYDPANWNSLIHYYPLNGDATDAVGSVNLTEEGGISYVTGVGDQAPTFDGSDDRLIGSSTSESYGSAISISAWFNFDLFSSGVFTALLDPAVNQGAGFTINGGTEQNLSAFLGTSDGSAGIGASPSALSTATKYHAVLTYDGSEAILYLDNSQELSVNHTGTLDSLDFDYVLGEDLQGGFRDMNYIDEFMVFDKGLSASEVDTLYQAGV